MEIILTNPKQIVTPAKILTIKPEKITTITSIEVTNMLDDPINKKVYASTKEVGTIVLWQGSDYDAIGQWTDQDVINRILELYN
jgi:hypothetical protein